MKSFLKYKLASFLCVISISGFSQKLTKEKAIELALERNYGILIANNATVVAENNKGILNSEYLPTLSASGAATYDNDNTTTSFDGALNDDGSVRQDIELTGAETKQYSASLDLDYTLFDGLGRHYNYKKYKEQYNLSKLEARETIENTILQLFSVYYEVARLTENVNVLDQTLEVSKKRITRAEYQFEYGQSTKLAILNAEVDVANDEINLLNAKQELKNTKRDLNVVINEKQQVLFEVDTSVQFIPKVKIEEFVQNYSQNNVTVLKTDSNLLLSDYDIEISKSGYLPTVGLSGSYGWNESINAAGAFFPENTVDNFNFSAGLSLSWNLFDGGSTMTSVKNAKIAKENQQLLKEQIFIEVKRDIDNSLGDYENLLKIFEIQQQNVITNKNNFDRSQEQFNRGLIASIEFRQAQINLLDAETNLNTAKYNAKLAELELLQLVGQLLNINF